VLGYGLYVNVLLYAALRLHGRVEQASILRDRINRPAIVDGHKPGHALEGLALPDRPHYALWSYKVHYSARYDPLGNSLAILFGITPRDKARAILDWTETTCAALRDAGQLALDLPPALIPTIQRHDPDWYPRYERFNQPGEYHNGAVWPMIAGWYIAARVAAGYDAQPQLESLAALMRPARHADLDFGFNEWFSAQDGLPRGENWQTWSAALLIYAAACVRQGSTPFFDHLRTKKDEPG
jgi:hypothetical protein